ncbi:MULTISPECIES: redox-sensing transcriptional repressor Rex [Limnochorda]|uniref:redox-sensing transcriptional repressor Rex n=1 Tax=Limnochorda TaxID=1676651 RepID=UPI0017C9D988|nr:redox-sensing transcriptional repressor Rex [Limnochorda pilosa]MBO2485852.1 redox-sensing transcriptional repressor Rex [Bacillota bacterium]MBO2519210.1 redox-sensing transcriptional repressor Rex [Bacillota bacterium]NMA71065.1 redox-sensing transcriptional repressor Rex [Bacillota bacterium]
MRWNKISDAVVRRLPLYLRVLDQAVRDGDKRLMSSQELGERAGVSPALVRKDLAWFGEFGKQGVGYEVAYLRDELLRILNLDKVVNLAIVGMGALGHALARYSMDRYQRDSYYQLRVAALFDADPEKIGEQVGNLVIQSVDRLEEVLERERIRMVVVAVPASAAQEIVDRCVRAGARAILNFAPVHVTAPEHVYLAHTDLSLELERLAYYLED